MISFPLSPLLRFIRGSNKSGKKDKETEKNPPQARNIDEFSSSSKHCQAADSAAERSTSPAHLRLPPAGRSVYIDLNVGGKIFRTGRDTLRLDSEGPLGELAEESSKKEIYFDRDPRHFHVILNFLRGTPFITQGRSVVELTEIVAEASFFGIHAIVKSAESQIKAMTEPRDKTQYEHVKACVNLDGDIRLVDPDPEDPGRNFGKSIFISDLSKDGWEPYWGNQQNFIFRRRIANV
jgi:hypothetical protein